ncbi:MAG TPA: hypothetical protein VEB21_01640 [Terriglobales bacterium]|nr:hypothetical protein [Terriglobales bacterium]
MTTLLDEPMVFEVSRAASFGQGAAEGDDVGKCGQDNLVAAVRKRLEERGESMGRQDGEIRVDELVIAITNSLEGCRHSPSI